MPYLAIAYLAQRHKGPQRRKEPGNKFAYPESKQAGKATSLVG